MRLWILSFCAMLAIATANPAYAGSPGDAQKFIDMVATDVLDILKTNDTAPVKLGKLEDVFTQAIDIAYVGKYVLARHWRTATPAQRQSYLAAYKPFVIKNYAGKLTRYSGQKYKLRNARAVGEDYAVTMEILDAGNPSIFVDYTLREEKNVYKVIDIAVEGISLRATQRSEFNSIVNAKGLDYLISALQKQAAKKK